ncbi:MAG: pyruvate:ferredoxin (flavodoxin) oxidoreductase [bacterium]
MKKILDGNTACSNVAYLFSEVCSIYPITPSSPMASEIDNQVNGENYNIFGSKPMVYEMQSEAGAAGTMHGSLLTGSLTTSFTASQGLLLMLPNMYKMAGEMLPGVIHVAARSLATQSLSIFGDHQDIYAARQTGFCMLASTNVYDAQNLAAVAHLSAIKGMLPFMHFFDGFRTSHELNTIKEIDKEELKKLVDFEKINEFKNRTLNVKSDIQYGMAENEDIYFQNMEVRNQDYDNIPDIVNNYMEKINNIMKTDYKPFNYYGHSQAEYVIVAMGSVCDTVKELLSNVKEERIGLIEVHLYRPFSKDYLKKVLPKTVKVISVLDRTKEAGSIGEPLFLDIAASLINSGIKILGGRYGLSSKNTTPSDIYDVYHNMQTECKSNFTIGIVDDVTNLSLDKQNFQYREDTKNIKIYGYGSDGMVSASKDILKLLNKKEEYNVQGYFEYDSKKSGGVTVSHLRISEEEINKPYYPTSVELVVVTKYEYLQKFEIEKDLEKNSILLLSTNKTEEEINSTLPSSLKEKILKNNIKVFVINANNIANVNGLNGKISKIVEYAIFLILEKDYKQDMIESIEKVFKTKGQEIINSNVNALNDVKDNIRQLNLKNEETISLMENNNIYDMINNRKGSDLKVSDMQEIKCGSFPCGLSCKEKRKITTIAPSWKSENCIECGKCSFVCPHAVIRPYIGKFETGKPYMMDKELNYEIKVSKEDCTGCGLCVSVCPGKNNEKALVMEEIKEYKNESYYFEEYENNCSLNKYTVKGSQFLKPKFQFSGACAGCGEAAYIKLLTQLMGDGLVIANATGCTSIYGGSAPSTPYTIPWANSLFEDNAEFALGMHLSYKQKRKQIKDIVTRIKDSSNLKDLYDSFLENFENVEITTEIKEKLIKEDIPEELRNLINYMPARVVWALGGDGWAYDIGYGGLDHVLHSGENIKILVLDTEVYSNTGGQASKSTKVGAVAEFANMGKQTQKKDLFKIATCIPNVYVASIAMGANDMQTLKSFKEAIEHDGPAIIIAYSPCIEHGIKRGLINSLEEQKLAVESGYTLLMRYNPKEEKLYVDSKEPNFEKYFDLLNNETRFNALYIKDKELASELFEKQKKSAIKRYADYKNIVNKD